jgi:hypothetical protein
MGASGEISVGSPFGRTVKDELVHLCEAAAVIVSEQGLAPYLGCCKWERLHQALPHQTPRQVHSPPPQPTCDVAAPSHLAAWRPRGNGRQCPPEVRKELLK